MLPKRPSKKDQKQTDSQQLNLESSLSTTQRIKKKRTLLLIVLALTVGLSIFFSLYRLSTNISSRFRFSLPKINISLPTGKKSIKTKINLDKPVKALLPSDDSWSIYVKTLQDPHFSWSLNFSDSNIDPVVKQLLSQNTTTSSLIRTSLPQGVEIRENIISSNNSFEYQTVISVPGQKALILIKTHDSQESRQLIPQLVKIIYWQIIRISS